MGQPTSSVGQRSNRTQLAEHMPVLAYAERGHGEHQFRLSLGARLVLMLLQSMLLPGRHLAWFRFTGRARFCVAAVWRTIVKRFPNLQRLPIRRRYFRTRRSRFLLFDGEHTYRTLPHRRRRLRFTTIF